MTLPLFKRVHDFILYPCYCQGKPGDCWGKVGLAYSGKGSAFKSVVYGIKGYGSITATLTSILSLGGERRLTAKIEGLKVLSWVMDV